MKDTKKTLLRWGYFALLIFVAACLLLLRFNNRFAIENQTSQNIKSLKVDVCQLTYAFSNIAAGKMVWSKHRVVGDSHYVVTGTLQDGTKIHGEGGYVSNGYMGMRDVLIAESDGGVIVKQSEIFP